MGRESRPELIDRGDGVMIAADPDAHAAGMAGRRPQPQTVERLRLAHAIKRHNREEAETRGWDPTPWRRSEEATCRRLIRATRRTARPRPRERRPGTPRSRRTRTPRSSRAGPDDSDPDPAGGHLAPRPAGRQGARA